MPFIEYNTDDIASILEVQTEPVMETTLLRKLASGFAYPSNEEASLFVLHFSLLNSLYGMKKDYGCLGYYIHIDTMRIRMLRFPDNGCLWYDETEGTFCGKPGCSEHKIEAGIKPDFSTSFYLNKDNINYESELNRDYINAVMYYGLHKKTVDEALDYFGIDSPDRDTVISRYRFLARKHHPDYGGNEESMKNLNRYYSILKKCFI